MIFSAFSAVNERKRQLEREELEQKQKEAEALARRQEALRKLEELKKSPVAKTAEAVVTKKSIGTLGGAAIGAKLLGSKLLATVVSGALTSIGTSMIIDGVTQMISPQQQNTASASSSMDQTDPAALASNYSFTGLTNVSRAGVPVNLVYGEILVGSITISNGVDTVQVEGSNE